VTAALYAFLAGLMTREALIWVGHRIAVARGTTAQAEAAARQVALEELAARYPVAFTHLLDEALADADVSSVPSTALLPHATDTTDGGPSCR
jgi:hypothetical protein